MTHKNDLPGGHLGLFGSSIFEDQIKMLSSEEMKFRTKVNALSCHGFQILFFD